MLLVAWIADGFEKALKPPRSADVLGRTGAFPRGATRISHTGGSRDYAFDDNSMPPVVAEIVGVLELRSFRSHVEKAGSSYVVRRITPAFAVVDAVTHSVDLELVEMAVVPAHRALHDVVKVGQRRRRRHLDTPPNRRFRVEQRDLEYVDRLRLRRHHHEPIRTPRRVALSHPTGTVREMGTPLSRLPSAGRPRERLLALGPEALSDVELIALQLRSGARGESAVDLACQLLARFGDTARLAEATVDELAAAPAIGVAKAASLVACFQLARRSHAQREQPGLVLRNAADVATVARVELAGLRRERVIVLVCNGQNRLIRVVKVSDGSIDRSLVGVREVLNAVLVNDGKAFAVAHNHPGGDARPSESDIAVTAQVAIASKTVGLRFLGHVAVADDDWSEIPLRPCPRTPD